MDNSRSKAYYEKMSTKPVSNLVISLAIPATISVLISNIYSMADTYFVSSLGVSESGATGIVYALMGVIQAIGYLFGTGAGSSISRFLGARDLDSAQKYAATTVHVGFLTGIVIGILGLIFITPLMYLLGSTEMILGHAKIYGRFILIAAPAMIVSLTVNNILRYEGKAVFSMIGLSVGGIVNIFGDYLLIRVAKMGIEGAGLATCVSQYISFVILLIPFFTGKSQLSISRKYVVWKLKLIKDVVFIGLPSLIRQGLFSVSSMTLNHCAAYVGGDYAIAAMSIVGRVTNVMYSFALGTGHGFQPVAGFNFGAKLYDRVKRSMKFMAGFGIVMMLIMSVFGYIFAPDIIRLFRSDDLIVEIGTITLRAQCLVLPILPIQICANMSHQCMGYVVRTALLASFRSGLFYIPIVLIGSFTLGLTGLEYAQFASDLAGTIASLPFLILLFRKLTQMQLARQEKIK